VSEESIKLVIADSEGTTCDAICSFLTGDSSYQVVGKAVDTDECLQLALIRRPDLIVVHNGLKPTSGLDVCEQIALQNPQTATLLVLGQSIDENLVRRILAAGVTEFLIAPLQKNRTLEVIRTAVEKKAGQRREVGPAAGPQEQHKIIVVCGPRGGCGRTMLAVNLACAIANAGEATGKRAALADLNVRGGDAATFLDLRPRRTLADVTPTAGNVDRELVESLLENHASGVTLLSASAAEPYDRLELSRGVVISALAVLRHRFPFTIVDAAAPGTEVSDATLDFCDMILLVIGMDLPRLRAARLYLHHLLEANFPREKIQIVLNDIQQESKSIGTPQAESILEMPITLRVPHDGRLVPASINLGRPFVLSSPDKAISRAIQELAGKLGVATSGGPGLRGLLKRFGLGARAEQKEPNPPMQQSVLGQGTR
jgi:pilus assembly protein CpaE